MLNAIKSRLRFSVGIISIIFLMTAPSVFPLDNGLARTPPMGWNSWNKFQCKDVSEQVIRETADAMVKTGMKDIGYSYIVIDDCWQIDRDSKGNIIADPKKFPSGIKALADYIHSKGLKFGIYSDAGIKTCAGRPGSKNFEFQDAKQYAAWGVDYFKYDWCDTEGMDAKIAYAKMRDAIIASGRPICFSMCEWGNNKPWLWGKDVGNLWRTTGDIQDCWDCKRDWGGMGWTRILDLQAGLEQYAGPGHWNDPDMLEVGNNGMTEIEYQAHFSFWCLLAAPLMAGNDLRNMTPTIHDILTNKEVIAVDQDPLGIQGKRIRDEGDFEVWEKPLQKNAKAIILFNRSAAGKEMTVSWKETGFDPNKSLKVRDLWAHKEMGKIKGSFTTQVPSHGVVMIKITP